MEEYSIFTVIGLSGFHHVSSLRIKRLVHRGKQAHFWPLDKPARLSLAPGFVVAQQKCEKLSLFSNIIRMPRLFLGAMNNSWHNSMNLSSVAKNSWVN